jgi:hypothetical protein
MRARNYLLTKGRLMAGGIGKALAHRELIGLIKSSLTREQSQLFNLRFEPS